MRCIWAVIHAAIFMIIAQVVIAGAFTYAGSIQFASGEYVSTGRTDNIYLINGLYYNTKFLRISASVPVIYQNSTGVSNDGAGGVVADPVEQTNGSSQQHGDQIYMTDVSGFAGAGVGDPLLRADVNLFKKWAGLPSTNLAVLVKIPVADLDTGFGTGEWDFGVGLSIAHTFNRTFISASTTYWSMGDPAYVELKNPIAYSIAAGHFLAKHRVSAMFSFFGYTQIFTNVEPLRQFAATLTYWTASRYSFNGGVILGLSESAPDFGLAFGWNVLL